MQRIGTANGRASIERECVSSCVRFELGIVLRNVRVLSAVQAERKQAALDTRLDH